MADEIVIQEPKVTPETFSKEYVSELRNENKAARIKNQELEAKTKEAQEAATKATAEAEAKVSATTQAANERILRAELKAAALKAGMIDLDGLKLADLSKVKLNDSGEVEGAEALMTAMKEAKPYLFGTASTTTQTKEPPEKKKADLMDASKLTKEELRAEKKRLGYM